MASQQTIANSAITNDLLPEDDQEDTEDLLVSEFPPPPYYYHRAPSLQPPPIPRQKLQEYSEKAAIVMKHAVAAMESKFDKASKSKNEKREDTTTDAMMMTTTEIPVDDEMEKNAAAHADLINSRVTVFGDITVEDPTLVPIPDDCADPTKVRDKVIRLNQKVMKGYVKLVNELVHKPLDNKECRDELSHNVLLMLHECNKFREHQAREILIQALEEQLKFRKTAVFTLREETNKASSALDKLKEQKQKKMKEETKIKVVEDEEMNDMDGPDESLDLNMDNISMGGENDSILNLVQGENFDASGGDFDMG